jgi:hypothetical protein
MMDRRDQYSVVCSSLDTPMTQLSTMPTLLMEQSTLESRSNDDPVRSKSSLCVATCSILCQCIHNLWAKPLMMDRHKPIAHQTWEIANVLEGILNT